MDKISIRGARVHNLKNVSVDIPKNSLTVITGVSGSGKSTLAFDTLYAEGQRRYVESLSSYARQFLGMVEKPDVESIEGLSPAISIEQKSISKNPRSTIGTTTEIYDYLRLLFARIGERHCHGCQKPFLKQTAQMIIDQISQHISQNKLANVSLRAPLVRQKKGSHQKLFEFLSSQGFSTVIINDQKFFTDEEIKLDKNKKHDISVQLGQFDWENLAVLPEAVETALKLSNGVADVCYGQLSKSYTTHSACLDCEISIPELAPRDFSFNAPNGACQSCHGLGIEHSFDVNLILTDRELSLSEGAIKPINKTFDYYYLYQFTQACQSYGLQLHHKPINQLTPAELELLLHGSNKYPELVGAVTYLKERYLQGDEKRRERLANYMRNKLCSTCLGRRLQPHILAVTIQGKSIIDLTEFNISSLLNFFQNLQLGEQAKIVAERLVNEITQRLSFLNNVGLGYLTLARSMASLSGGESQRIRLATQIGTNLTGVIYVLDEPSIGLHQRDNQRLIQTLMHLKNLGNTVVVVEHDTETIEVADYLIDIGPGAGVHGGQVVATGSKDAVSQNPASLTGAYLTGKKKIERKSKAIGQKWIKIVGAKEHNLKNLTVEIPQGNLTCITGVSGSGKSTLINEILAKALSAELHGNTELAGQYEKIEHELDSIIVIDQSPIGRTPHSNPATYTKIFDLIREIFAQTKEAQLRGYRSGRFSFNVTGGRCEACQGHGSIKMEMHFLPDVYVPCSECLGQRYNSETLEITYKGKNIHDVLKMTVADARLFFENVPTLAQKLQTLIDVGLEYIELGQSALTFSGGEAQRIKLSRELAKRSKQNSLYILDEPTTGLHFEDINKLLKVLDRLVASGATCIIIEHNLDLIRNADYVIDLGPEGGAAGGEIVAIGTPQEVAQVQASFTGKYLKPYFQNHV